MSKMPVNPVTPRAPRINPNAYYTPPVTRRPAYHRVISQPNVSPSDAFGGSWQRRHTLGELATFPFPFTRHNSYHGNLATAGALGLTRSIDSVALETDRSASPTVSDTSDGGASFLTSETFHLVRDMDRDEREGFLDDKKGHDSGSRPWLYRRYSHQVLSQTHANDDKPMFAVRARPPKHDEEWDDQELQERVKEYVDTVKREKVAKGVYQEPEPYDDLTEDVEELNQSTAESGYMTPSSASQIGDISMEPVVIDIPHYPLEELPIEAVNPLDYPELVHVSTRIPESYTSQTTMRLSGQNNGKVKSKVNLVVLTYEELEQYRDGFC